MYEVSETNKMIEQENLDVRTITLGISLMDCIDSDLNELNRKIYEKITVTAKDLVSTGKHIEREFGIPIVNKRISITPIALIGGAACKCPEDFVTIAETLDKAAKEVGVNFIGGYSALVSKGMTKSDENLIRSIPQALARTERVCSSVNVGSTRTGINMDAVRLCGEMVKETAEATKERDSFGCAKLVIFCNAPDDNPFMAGAFLGVTEADAVINVGVSGPGVVKKALEKVRGKGFEELCETIKKTAFKVTRVGQLVAGDEEAARRGIHDSHAVHALGDDRDAQPGAAADDLTDGGHEQHGQDVADAHAQTVQRRVHDGVLAGEHLGTAQNDAVDDDQRQIHAQRLVQVGHERLQHHLHDGNKRCDDNDVARQMHLGRDDLAQCRDNNVGADQNKGHGQTHAHGTGNGGGDGQCGAAAQHQTQNGVFTDDTGRKNLPLARFFVHRYCTPLISLL